MSCVPLLSRGPSGFFTNFFSSVCVLDTTLGRAVLTPLFPGIAAAIQGALVVACGFNPTETTVSDKKFLPTH